jgi:hypothetical protein
MIRGLRALFLLRPLREKVLIVALLTIATVWWLQDFAGRVGDFLSEQRSTSLELSDQTEWLSHQDQIFASAKQSASKLDPSRTFDETRLATTVSGLARDAGLENTTSGDAQNERSGQFSIHTIGFTVSKTDWGSLEHFYLSLQKYAPYIGIEGLSIVADRANPTLLNASLKISSVEISASGAAAAN